MDEPHLIRDYRIQVRNGFQLCKMEDELGWRNAWRVTGNRFCVQREQQAQVWSKTEPLELKTDKWMNRLREKE